MERCIPVLASFLPNVQRDKALAVSRKVVSITLNPKSGRGPFPDTLSRPAIVPLNPKTKPRNPKPRTRNRNPETPKPIKEKLPRPRLLPPQRPARKGPRCLPQGCATGRDLFPDTLSRP
ncbi:hypothetical protein T484DRAFT_1748332 [Baffinella frigidus]|nr:hypothetical protein T484DRAFT_1748332 [Cryptophyta sp. CCMP2293]